MPYFDNSNINNNNKVYSPLLQNMINARNNERVNPFLMNNQPDTTEFSNTKSDDVKKT